MKQSLLQSPTEQSGPWASAYLDTSWNIDACDGAIGLRWRHQHALRAQGTDSATLPALEAAVGTDRDLAGPHGQALFNTRRHLALVLRKDGITPEGRDPHRGDGPGEPRLPRTCPRQTPQSREARVPS